jgi:hypothetical protein
MAQTYGVGQPYDPARAAWPEGAEFRARPGTLELHLFWRELSPPAIAGVRRGRAEFALFIEPPVLWLLYRFYGACDWVDVPCSWHQLPESQRGLPLQDPVSPARMPFTVVLVEAATGVITVVRPLTVSPVFAAALDAALRAQAQQPWSPLRYKAACTMAYDRYPTGAAMAQVAQYRTRGRA